jgi:hypothetical protein
MAGWFVIALTWVMAAPDGARTCTMAPDLSTRPHRIMELTLRATPDSVRDPYRAWARAPQGGHRARLPGDTAAVYAQVFTLVRAEGVLGPLETWRDRRVALVWWGLGMQCQRSKPYSAVKRDVRELFLIARPAGSATAETEVYDPVYTDLRPRSQWILGMPTFDVGASSLSYSPGDRRFGDQGTIRGDMSVAEYRDLFARLPRFGESSEQQLVRWRALVRWADDEPRRWKLYPSGLLLCGAEKWFLGDRSTWSRGRCAP